MKRKTKQNNPLAHADGSVSTNLGKKIDASKLQEGSLEVFQARKKLKAMFEEFKGNIKTCEMPKLAYYKRIGYGSAADYRGFGQQIWNYPYESSKRDQKNWDIKLSKNFATNAAWEDWSRNYYPQMMQNVYTKINQYFQTYYPKEILAIAETTDKSEKSSKQKELQDNLSTKVLENIIKTVIKEGEDDYQSIFDCIKTFVLYPQQVLEHQYKYVNEIERQEGTNAAAMKSYANEKHTMFNTGNFTSTIDAINDTYSTINTYNRALYQKALLALPKDDFAQIVNDNILIANNFIKDFTAIDVGITISEDYTNNVATADVNQTGLQYGSGENKSTTSDRKMLFLGVGILGVLIFIKKKKK